VAPVLVDYPVTLSSFMPLLSMCPRAIIRPPRNTSGAASAVHDPRHNVKNEAENSS